MVVLWERPAQARRGSRERNPLCGFRLSALIPDAEFCVGFLEAVGDVFHRNNIIRLNR